MWLMVMSGSELDCAFDKINEPKSRAPYVIPKYTTTSRSIEITINIFYCP